MKPGPLDLIEELDAPEIIYSTIGIEVARASGIGGILYEIIPGKNATVADLLEGLAHIPEIAKVRDAFNANGELCVNFWEAAPHDQIQ